MVAEVVQYFLIMEQRKFPIKRSDVVKLLNLKGHSLTKTYKTVMTEVGKYLNDVILRFSDNVNFLIHENVIRFLATKSMNLMRKLVTMSWPIRL